MQHLDDDDRKAVLGEVLIDELKIIREYLEYLLPIKPKVDKLERDVEQLKVDTAAIKAVLTDHSGQLRSHEIRITDLEAAH